MGKICYPPEPIEDDDYLTNHILFLAGSIEMDTAENWQDVIGDKLGDIDNLLIMNPRRKHWDSNWIQSIDNPIFKHQVEWELNGIDCSDTIIFYFDPKTKSPITLMELGIASQLSKEKNLIICCPEGFWRKGNVDILCSRMSHNNVIIVKNLTELAETSHDFISYQTRNGL